MNMRYIILLFLWVVMLCSGCSQEKKKALQGQTVYTVAEKQYAEKTFLSGTISPLNVSAVTSQVFGRVEQVNFKPGFKVEKGQTLYTVDISDMQKKLQTALMTFLKDKDALNSAQNNLKNNQLLFDAGILSANDHAAAQQTVSVAQLSYDQSMQNLKAAMPRVSDEDNRSLFQNLSDLKKLKLKDVKKVELFLEKMATVKRIEIHAPLSGIALASVSSRSARDDANSQVKVNSSLKSGQVVAHIATMDGIVVRFVVGELDVNKLFVGQQAMITSPVIPSVVLQGVVSAVSLQANNNLMPTFNARVRVEKLPTIAKKNIRFGMRVKIQLVDTPQKGIMIPIAAVSNDSDQTEVQLIDSSGVVKNVKISTGMTTLDSVIVTSGLKAGDKILVPN